jgi:hypothetical protein
MEYKDESRVIAAHESLKTGLISLPKSGNLSKVEPLFPKTPQIN